MWCLATYDQVDLKKKILICSFTTALTKELKKNKWEISCLFFDIFFSFSFLEKNDLCNVNLLFTYFIVIYPCYLNIGCIWLHYHYTNLEHLCRINFWSISACKLLTFIQVIYTKAYCYCLFHLHIWPADFTF